MKIERDPKYLHPILRATREPLKAALDSQLPSGTTARVISMHRTPAEQFELFKKGRVSRNGKYIVVDKSKVVTGKDGYVNVSRHNTLPCTAMDIGLFATDPSGKERYLQNSVQYDKIGPAAAAHLLDWGGDWTSLIDKPHVQVPLSRFFQNSVLKDVALQWQRYLLRAGKYSGAADGIFGEKSQGALFAVAGTRDRTIAAWDRLYAEFGPVEGLP